MLVLLVVWSIAQRRAVVVDLHLSNRAAVCAHFEEVGRRAPRLKLVATRLVPTPHVPPGRHATSLPARRTHMPRSERETEVMTADPGLMISLTSDEALVLFELLHRLQDAGGPLAGLLEHGQSRSRSGTSPLPSSAS